MSSYALYTLRDLRIAEERRAEQALGEAAAIVRRAELETTRLTAHTVEARAAEAAARATAPAAPGSSAQAQTVRRFSERLRVATRTAVETLERHQAQVVTPAVRAEAGARAAHLRARQRREVVEKAIARREALRRREQERREEAAADDLGRRRKS